MAAPQASTSGGRRRPPRWSEPIGREIAQRHTALTAASIRAPIPDGMRTLRFVTALVLLAGCSDGYVLRLIPEAPTTTRQTYDGVRPIANDVPLPVARDAGPRTDGVAVGTSLCGPQARSSPRFVGADIREGGDHVEVLCAP